jgi:hypothetical protein
MRNYACIVVATLTLGLAHGGEADARGIQVTITPAEIQIIREYYAQEAQKAPARGRGRDAELPPGIARNLARGKPLPPGIAKQHLPQSLEQRLPPPPDGYERIVLDGRVLLVEIATQVIHDVLSDLILR